MSEQIRQIAARIKELREILGMSLESVAKDLDITVETYKEYESGNSDIPIGFLYKLANKFGVELTAILTGDGPRLRTYSVVRKGKGMSVQRTKFYDYHSLAYNFIDKKAEPFLVTVEPEGEDVPTPLNSHSGQEFNYVLEGTLKITIDGHAIVLREGDSLYFDSSLSHGMKALNNKTARFLAIIF
ncbi:MAG: helix-turn-helix domain-containing protein [Acetivibrionales bacterium]|jgi:transcriptional regulator with XRE-family HTH domain